MEYPTGLQENTKESRKPSRLARLFFVFGLLVVVAFVTLVSTTAPSNTPANDGIFTVPNGASLKSIGTLLKDGRYIRSRVLFSTIVTFLGGEHRISPGDYYFVPGENVFGIAQQIATDTHNLLPIKVTIPEGENMQEVAGTLSSHLPGFDENTFLSQAKPFEGYLFPETYFFYPKTTAEEVLKEMRAMFEQQTSSLFTSSVLATHTKNQIVTMASLIEREAHGADDRAMIAGILWNRISIGMALQVDATVAYASGVPEGALAKADFSVDSPYNTYLYKGLPPGPIASPGLEALRAAVNPTPTAYLYYLHDKHGTIHYAKTYAEHLANIKKFLR